MIFKNGYKAVFFDLDGTLRHSVPQASDVFNDKTQELGFSLTDEVKRSSGRWEHQYWASSDLLREDAEKFKDDEDGFWGNYTERRLKSLGANPAQIQALAPPLSDFMHEYRHEDFVPPELHEILPSLRTAGFKLGVLSNRTQPFADQMVELKLADYFEFIKAAGELGAWKPNPQVFTPLLEAFELAPEESVYVGDNYYADVVGARAAGITPILYDPRELFPDADCARITSFTELLEVL